MATRIFLLLAAAIWLPYGIYCFVEPARAACAGTIPAAAVAKVRPRSCSVNWTPRAATRARPE
ncbi:MAG: hypothetical protein H6Q91_2988 [Deltaproteobacteria bacterium]|nr:hypothetical protein [Deltaproteobacteria bacterium]